MPEFDMFAAISQQFGPPTNRSPVTEEYARSYRDKLPPSLLRFWMAQGWGDWKEGRIWLTDPAPFTPLLDRLFSGDSDFHPSDITVYGYSAFGEIYMWHRKLRGMKFNSLLSMMTVANAESYADIDTGTPTSEDFTIGVDIFGLLNDPEPLLRDSEGTDMFPLAIQRLGRLAPGEIYGFVPALAIGGPLSSSNLCKVAIVEHIDFLISLERPTLYAYDEQDGSFGELRPLRTVGR